MADEERFAAIVSLACHDLRTPLATVSGFAKTLVRNGGLDERTTRFLGMIDGASDQLAGLLDDLSVLARIEAGRYEPALVEADTLELATSADERVSASGTGEAIATDEPSVRRGLEALAIAAVRHGGVETVVWTVDGRVLTLATVNGEAGPVVAGEEVRDLGSIVARAVIEALGGELALDGETLLVRL
jgi:two-component system OmpR family sensor kinase